MEGVAAPCETPDAVDIFAWATFDGEGSHDLRLYEDNENYRDDFRAANPALHPDWVFPLCRLSDAQRAIDELRERLDVMNQCADNYSRMFEESSEECAHLKDCLENDMLHIAGLVAERDTLREECERLRVFNKSLDEEATKRLQDVIEAENEAHTLRQQLAEEREHYTFATEKLFAAEAQHGRDEDQ